MSEIATWRRMRSGDWKLTVPGRQWAVAFVWKTKDHGYAYMPSASTPAGYHQCLSDAKLAARRLWEWLEARR